MSSGDSKYCCVKNHFIIEFICQSYFSAMKDIPEWLRDPISVNYIYWKTRISFKLYNYVLI